MEYLVNTAVKLPVTSTGLATGQASLPVTFLKDGLTVAGVAPTFSELGSGLYTVNFTPASTGKWTVFVGGKTYDLEVVSKTLQNVLGDVFDQCLGSWSWNKNSGLLTLYRGDGSTMATYNVVDNVETASRERVS